MTAIKLFGDTERMTVPFMMLLATPTPYDVEAVVNREDGMKYNASRQVNVFGGGETTMGRCTCHRKNSTGIVFTDNDRQTDD